MGMSVGQACESKENKFSSTQSRAQETLNSMWSIFWWMCECSDTVLSMQRRGTYPLYGHYVHVPFRDVWSFVQVSYMWAYHVHERARCHARPIVELWWDQYFQFDQVSYSTAKQFVFSVLTRTITERKSPHSFELNDWYMDECGIEVCIVLRL